jgi:hypothetical protein
MHAENRNPSGHKRYTFNVADKVGDYKSMGQIRNMFSFGRKVKLKNALCDLLIPDAE